MKTRRHFLWDITAGSIGMGVLPLLRPRTAGAIPAWAPGSDVSFTAGSDRRQNIIDVLKPFEDELSTAIQGKRVILKPNNVWHGNPLCATHPDALRGALDVLSEMTDRKITIAESTASPNGTMYTFEEYGYFPLKREYNVDLADLNQGTWSGRWIIDNMSHPQEIKIIDDFLDPDNFIISITRFKTHDSVVATLAYKNMILASPVNFAKTHPQYIRNQQEKAKMHSGGPVGINWNMFQIAPDVRPEFCVLDGFVGMEGNGPNGGTPVEHGVALASNDVVAIDRVAIELMGINHEDVGYLQWCSSAGIGEYDLNRITIIGPDLHPYIVTYKLHDNIERQLQWIRGYDSSRRRRRRN